MPRKAMKVVVELDIHTVRILGRLLEGILAESSAVANDARRMHAKRLCGRTNSAIFLLFVRFSGDMPGNIPTRLRLCLSQSKLHGFRS